MLRTVALLVVFLAAPQVEAAWSAPLTSHMWDDVDTNANGFADCPDDYADGLFTPGRHKGGWYEWRFPTSQGSTAYPAETFFLPDWTHLDAARQCPSAFAETTMNHFHGVMNHRTGVHNGALFAVYDSSSGYYHANKIKLQQDPSPAINPGRLLANDLVYPITSAPSTAINNKRPYTVAELVRNGRSLVDTDPGSSRYVGFNQAGLGCTAAALSANPALPSAWFVDLGGQQYRIDRNWSANHGKDHESTKCAPPAAIQTMDPDISLRSDGLGEAVIAWTERYVEYTNAQNGEKGIFPYNNPPSPNAWYPYRPLVVHVAKVDRASLLGGHSNYGMTIPTTYLSPASALNEAGLNVATQGEVLPNLGTITIASAQAIAPRVTQVQDAGVIRPIVAWGELPFAFAYGAGEFGDDLYQPASSTATLYAKIGSLSSTSWTQLGSSIGTACSIQEVRSGRATGRVRSYTATHDIDYITDAGLQVPIVVMGEASSDGQCRLVVKKWSGNYTTGAGTWTTYGGTDLRVAKTAATTPSWPRISVHNGVIYITWIEHTTDAGGLTKVHAARYNSFSATFDVLAGAGGWFSQAGATPTARGTALAISDVSIPATTADDGANVYVSYVRESATPGVWVNSVNTCRTRVSAMTGGLWSCDPLDYNEERRRSSGTQQQPIYQSVANQIGYAWGQASVGIPLVMPVNFTAGVLAKQLMNYVPDDVFSPANGSADLAMGGITSDGLPSALFSTWPGPGQNHRSNDMTLMAKADTALLSEAAKLAIGERHALAIDPNGQTMTAWGDNAFGQLGLGDTAPRTLPRRLTLPAPELPILRVSAGALFSTALSATGKIYTWGANSAGQICNGTSGAVPAAAPFATSTPVGSSGFVDVAAGADFFIGLTKEGTVFGCGQNAQRQLGSGATANVVTGWVQVKIAAGNNLSEIVAIAAGGRHACAIRKDNTVWCWGNNTSGELGRGTSGAAPGTYAAQVSGSTFRARKIALGDNFTIAAALAPSTALYAWGANASGQLGLSTAATLPTATSLPSRNALGIAAGKANSYVLIQETTKDTTLYATGADASGQMGEGANAAARTSFTVIADQTTQMRNARQVVAGAAASTVYALNYNLDTSSATSDWNRLLASASCWGEAGFGQCGTGVVDLFVPIQTWSPAHGFPCSANANAFVMMAPDRALCSPVQNSQVMCSAGLFLMGAPLAVPATSCVATYH